MTDQLTRAIEDVVDRVPKWCRTNGHEWVNDYTNLDIKLPLLPTDQIFNCRTSTQTNLLRCRHCFLSKSKVQL